MQIFCDMFGKLDKNEFQELMASNMCWRVLFPSPPISTTKEGLLDHPRPYGPLTLCKTRLNRSFHWYTMHEMHTPRRDVSSRQMTDNIFEIETAAFAHVACAPRESGILLTDSAATTAPRMRNLQE